METASKGASAYFSAPEPDLDPALFTGTILKEDVRAWIIAQLLAFWDHEGITAGPWLHAWLAGSGVSHQWSADRGNGDLDVLLGIDYDVFIAANPGLKAGNRADLAAVVNEQMRAHLWPLTAAAELGGKKYEVTYYWNPEVSGDITIARPYAAWNLETSTWDVPPLQAPTVTEFPRQWHEQAAADAARARQVYTDYSGYLADASRLPASNPRFAASMRGLDRTTAELRLIWETLHEGRRSAFSAPGQGYGDWHNFRWQAAKANGTVDLLRGVIREADQRKTAAETRLFGAPVVPAEIALQRAATRYTAWGTR